MTPQIVIFFVLALIAIAAAVGMLFSRNAVYSALFLVLNFGVVAVFFLMLNAPFVAIAQISVYMGAIMVLFLFVIMLLGADFTFRRKNPLPWQTPLAAFLAVLFLGALAGVVILGWGAAGAGAVPAAWASPATGKLFGAPRTVGLLLFSDYLLPFQITGLLLLVGMVGAVVLNGEDRASLGPTPPEAAEEEGR